MAVIRAQTALLEELKIHEPSHPAWGILWTMFKRGAEHARATVALWATGFPAQAEVCSRSVFEHSITLMYLLRDDAHLAITAYLQSLLSRERKFLKDLAETEPGQLRDSLDQRRRVLGFRETVVAAVVRELGRDPTVEAKWPSLLDRCRTLGLEQDYRLFYSQLSAQAHADPEDILNEFMVRIRSPELLEHLAVETTEFSWTMTKASLDLFIRSVQEVSKVLARGEAAKVAGDLQHAIPLTFRP